MPANTIFIPKHFNASTHFIFHMLSPGVWQMVTSMCKDTAGWQPQRPPHQPDAIILEPRGRKLGFLVWVAAHQRRCGEGRGQRQRAQGPVADTVQRSIRQHLEYRGAPSCAPLPAWPPHSLTGSTTPGRGTSSPDPLLTPSAQVSGGPGPSLDAAECWVQEQTWTSSFSSPPGCQISTFEATHPSMNWWCLPPSRPSPPRPQLQPHSPHPSPHKS